ncbi:interferon alpha-21-like [Pristis pectinata]|uniref:interferon alpha-21-like n=1 Tax=Pristis pectinata TaxID=685728 RepID=UPI00223E3C60|nr:interferon alpha-21-like [Pristis pectinata]
MVLPNAWRRCILLVLLPGILAQGCRVQQEGINQDAQRVLNEMGGPLTRQCSLEKPSLGAKTLNLSKLVERGQERISVVYQTVRQISKIYSMNLGSVTWPQDKLESLRVLLDGQLRELQTCGRKPGSGSRPRKSAAIKKYFRELSKFLKRKGFSACAWEITRAETRAYFQQFPRIMAEISE